MAAAYSVETRALVHVHKITFTVLVGPIIQKSSFVPTRYVVRFFHFLYKNTSVL